MKLFGFAGYSGSGKTTLIEKLLPLFLAEGICVSVIKHVHHDVDLDQPGKDSWRFRAAGCHEVLISGQQRWALLHEIRAEAQPTLDALLAHLSPCDVVLVEGYKFEPMPKIEVWRSELARPNLFLNETHIIALASDSVVHTALPQFDINAIDRIARFIKQTLEL